MVEKDESINYQFTKAGHDLAIRALAGVTQLDFTRAVTSTDNHFADTEADTLAITELANIKQTIDLKEVDAVDDDPSFVKVPVVINKAEMEEDYALLTIGLYCKPKDGDEVLYSVCAMQDPIYMHKSSNNSTYSIDLNTLVGSAANVVIKVDPAGMVTNATFDAFKVTMGQQYALKSDLDAYLKSLPANVALTDKANVFTEQQVLSAGAVNGAGAPALFKGDVDVPSDVVRADMLKPNLIDVATDEWLLANATRDDYTFTAVKGQTYNIGVAAQIGTDGEVFALQLRVPSDTDSSHLDLVATKVSGSAQQLYKSWTATVDGVIRLRPAYNVPSGSGLTGADVLFRYVVVTNSTTQVSYPTAQYNRHAYAIDKEQDIVGTNNLIATSSWIALAQYGYYTADGGSLMGSNGAIDDIHSDYISIAPQTMMFTWYSIPTGGGATVHSYDSTKKWIKSFPIPNAVGSTKIDLPANTAFIAINVPNPNTRSGLCKLTVGDVKTDWTPAPEDKVNVSDMRKPANQVASIDEVNAKQDKIGYTPADDDNVIHRDPNTGAVTESGNFPELKVKGVSVATSDDLKSLEDASWHTITGNNESLSSYICLYKKNNEEKYVDLILHGIMGTGKNTILNTPDIQTELLDLKDIVSAPKEVSGRIVCLSNVNGSGFVEISGTKLTFAWYSTVLSVGSRIESTNSSDDTPFLRVTFD